MLKFGLLSGSFILVLGCGGQDENPQKSPVEESAGFEAPKFSQEIILKTVRGLPTEKPRQAILEILASNPSVAMKTLLFHIRTVSPIPVNSLEPWILSDEAMHMIWCIRAMNALTGKRIYSEIEGTYGSSEHEERRKAFLRREENPGTPFFAVWMSRDTHYIASIKVQKDIIEKWKRWYSREGQTFKYPTPKSLPVWYFY